MNAIQYEATHISVNRWVVRPKGQLGTCGEAPIPWTSRIVHATSAEEAIRKATQG